MVLYSLRPNWFIHTGTYTDGVDWVKPKRPLKKIKTGTLFVNLKINKKNA